MIEMENEVSTLKLKSKNNVDRRIEEIKKELIDELEDKRKELHDDVDTVCDRFLKYAFKKINQTSNIYKNFFFHREINEVKKYKERRYTTKKFIKNHF